MNSINKVWKLIWDIYYRKKEIWNYLIFGALGVIVSITSYWICRKIGLNIEASNVISWIIAVLFMYVTNKNFVFESKSQNKKELIKEFVSFVTARLFTLLIETLILFVGARYLKINDIIVKVIAQIVIIILNYIFSKVIIFRK